MPTFLRSVIVDAPLETVFGFHEKDDALRLLSPAFPPVRIIGKTGGIRVGARVELSGFTATNLWRWVNGHK